MSDVKTWQHDRKGMITGSVVSECDTWLHIRLTGNHELRYMSEALRGSVDRDSEVITVRKSLVTEVKKL